MTLYEEYNQFAADNGAYSTNEDENRSFEYKFYRAGYTRKQFIWEGDPVIIIYKHEYPIAGHIFAHRLTLEPLRHYLKKDVGNRYDVKIRGIQHWDVTFEILG